MTDVHDDSGEDDMDAPGMEKDQGDGNNLTRPDNSGDGSKAKTQDSLDKLGKGKPYGCTNGGCYI